MSNKYGFIVKNPQGQVIVDPDDLTCRMVDIVEFRGGWEVSPSAGSFIVPMSSAVKAGMSAIVMPTYNVEPEDIYDWNWRWWPWLPALPLPTVYNGYVRLDQGYSPSGVSGPNGTTMNVTVMVIEEGL